MELHKLSIHLANMCVYMSLAHFFWQEVVVAVPGLYSCRWPKDSNDALQNVKRRRRATEGTKKKNSIIHNKLVKNFNNFFFVCELCVVKIFSFFSEL
jgi:hypothetical protein